MEKKMKIQNDAGKRKLAKKGVNQPAKVTIRKLPTGVRGLDDILGGGIPEFSLTSSRERRVAAKPRWRIRSYLPMRPWKNLRSFSPFSANPP